MIDSKAIQEKLKKLSGAMSVTARFQTTHFCSIEKNGELLIETKRNGVFHYWIFIDTPNGRRPELISTSEYSIFADRGKSGIGSRLRSFKPEYLHSVSPISF